MCGPHRRFAPLLSCTLRRIPQEVGVVATRDITIHESGVDAGKFQYRKR